MSACLTITHKTIAMTFIEAAKKSTTCHCFFTVLLVPKVSALLLTAARLMRTFSNQLASEKSEVDVDIDSKGPSYELWERTASHLDINISGVLGLAYKWQLTIIRRTCSLVVILRITKQLFSNNHHLVPIQLTEVTARISGSHFLCVDRN